MSSVKGPTTKKKNPEPAGQCSKCKRTFIHQKSGKCFKCKGEIKPYKRSVKIDFGAPLPPTKKQMAFIRDIECYVNVEFTGETLEEASEYISTHIEDYYYQKHIDELDEDELEDWSGRP